MLTKEESYQYSQDRWRTRKDTVDRIKGRTPCTDCGVQYPPYVMQFDHVRGYKVGNISEMYGKSWKILHAEIAKCEIVCANCHAERTHSRLTGTAWYDKI